MRVNYIFSINFCLYADDKLATEISLINFCSISESALVKILVGLIEIKIVVGKN